MKRLPALTQMGVQNPEQIARYALYMSDNTDILRIIYNRKKGSILAVSTKFTFPRIKKSTLVDSGTRQTEIVYESSQEFRNAIAELDYLMDEKKSADDVKKLISEEVRLLEVEVSLRLEYIKSLIKKL